MSLSDDAVDRIAARVAERLASGALLDRFSAIVNNVSERLVRDEIARIRATAQSKNP
jgi:hypothetical protein